LAGGNVPNDIQLNAITHRIIILHRPLTWAVSTHLRQAASAQPDRSCRPARRRS
jgi:hypothetical protein